MLQLPDLSNEKLVCIDVETYDPNLKTTGPSVRTGGYIVGIAIGTKTNSWYFPIDHAQGRNLNKNKIIKWAKKELSRNNDKLFANALYDLDYLFEEGINVGGRYHDILIAEPLIYENKFSYSLNDCAKKYLNETKTDEELYKYCAQHFGGKPTRNIQAKNIWKCPPEIVSPYAKSDVELPIKIFEEQKKWLSRDELDDVYNLEIDLVPMVLAMKRRGVRINKRKANKMIQTLEIELEDYQNQLNDMAGMEVNTYASASLAEAFDNLGLKYPKTELGNPSFTQDFLEGFDHPIGKLIRAVKTRDKQSSTFISGTIFDHEVKGRIHSQLNQLKSEEYGTVTGRFSCSMPNLQQIPRDKTIRSLYIPEPGEDWYKLDQSQIEYRLACHYARGRAAEKIREQYITDPDTDFHQAMADLIGIERRPAKDINFGFIYGMGITKLGLRLGLNPKESKILFNTVHRKAPFMKQLLTTASNVASRRGYVRTLSGRRRRFDRYEPFVYKKGSKPLPFAEAKEEYGRVKRAFTYKALNAIVQGGAADIMKKGMVDIYKSGVMNILGAPLLQVHDELDWSVPKTKEGKEAILEVKHLMEAPYKLKVPVITDMEKGPNWGDVKTI